MYYVGKSMQYIGFSMYYMESRAQYAAGTLSDKDAPAMDAGRFPTDVPGAASLSLIFRKLIAPSGCGRFWP